MLSASTSAAAAAPHHHLSYLLSAADRTAAGHSPHCQQQCPLVYSPLYNISFFGIEKWHPFDSKKWGRVFRILSENGVCSSNSVVPPKEARKEDLLLVHSEQYLRSLEGRAKLATILEVGLVLCFPACLVDRRVLRPMRFQTGGTVLAARLCLDHGWAINIGGGFHHASSDKGGGFCVYADITLAIRILLDTNLIKRAMIVDLDAHQGNGHERDFALDRRVYILDFFNAHIYPNDGEAKMAISRAIPLDIGIGDCVYLRRLTTELEAAFLDCRHPSPDIIIYNAGTDSLSGDPLGLLQLSPKGIAQRDEIVFRAALMHKVPITMVTSGGYTRGSAQAIADSILNLNRKGLIKLSC